LRLGDDLLAAVARLAADRRLQALHEVLLARLNGAKEIDWSQTVVDSSHVRLQYRSKPGG
jgi:hypothetical protein